MPIKQTKEIFIEKAKNYHNNKYDYSLIEYKNNKTKVKIICPIHGIFDQTPVGHLAGGCRLCGHTKTTNKNKKSDELFILAAKKIHCDKYDYSLVNYKNSHTNVTLLCPVHGKFNQTPNNHLKGHGCGKCMPNLGNKNIFIEKAKQVHNNKYDYSLVEYKTSKHKVKIICHKHGMFEQTPDRHILRGQGCPNCKESKGEKIVRQLLLENNIEFIPQHTFDNCKNKLKLPFDFYLPKFNICIEYHGEQHYKPIKFFGGIRKFKEQQKRDNIKLNYCYNNNIKLIIIKYTQRNIKKYLSKYSII